MSVDDGMLAVLIELFDLKVILAFEIQILNCIIKLKIVRWSFSFSSHRRNSFEKHSRTPPEWFNKFLDILPKLIALILSNICCITSVFMIRSVAFMYSFSSFYDFPFQKSAKCELNKQLEGFSLENLYTSFSCARCFSITVGWFCRWFRWHQFEV